MNRTFLKSSLIALTIGVACSACGGGKSEKQTAADVQTMLDNAVQESATQTQITAQNWQSEVKNRYGISLTPPKGWEFATVSYYFDGKIVILDFAQKASDAASRQEFATAVFNATKAVSAAGNYELVPITSPDSEQIRIEKGKTYATFAQTNVTNDYASPDFINAAWYYTFNGEKIVSLDSDEGKNFSVKFEIYK